MAILARTRYDHDGDLLQVRESDLRASGAYGGDITVDPGHYHAYTLIASSVREREHLAHQFNDQMQAVDGYRLLAVLPTDIVGGTPGSMAPAGFVRYTARMVYAIESERTRPRRKIRARRAS